MKKKVGKRSQLASSLTRECSQEEKRKIAIEERIRVENAGRRVPPVFSRV